jgi:hypothetical protein
MQQINRPDMNAAWGIKAVPGRVSSLDIVVAAEPMEAPPGGIRDDGQRNGV